MTVATWQTPNFAAQTGTVYKTALENAIVTGERIARAFAPHGKTIPDLNVVFDAGFVFNDQVLAGVATQTISAGAAPAANPRIDRYVVDRLTGVITRIAGTEAASPVAPAIPEEKDPICQVLMVVGMTTVTNQDITDERLGGGGGGGVVIKLKSGANQTVANSTTETIITAATKDLAGGMLGTDNFIDFFIDISDLDLVGGINVAFRAKYDGTLFAALSFTPTDSCAGAANQAGLLWIRLRNDGATNAQRGFMIAFLPTAITGERISVGTAAIDSTITKSFTFTVQFSATGAGNSVTISGQQGVKYS